MGLISYSTGTAVFGKAANGMETNFKSAASNITSGIPEPCISMTACLN